MNEINMERFRVAYRAALVAAVEKQPAEFHFTVEQAPGVADKMTQALANGTANLGAAGKAAARKCGIKPTQTAIRAFLTEGA